MVIVGFVQWNLGNLSSTILIVTKTTCLVVSVISKVILSFSFLSSILNVNLAASLSLSQ